MKPEIEDDAREAFSLWDRDGDGYLTMDESRTALQSIKEKPIGPEFAAYFLELSLDGEGHIDVYEFVNLAYACKD
jgi:calmodulin